MTRTFLVVSLAIANCGVVSSSASADERVDATRALQFWKTLAKGDTLALKTFYASRIVLKAGSELLKPKYAITKDADRSKDLLVSRGDLLQAYGRMIDGVGKENVVRSFRAD